MRARYHRRMLRIVALGIETCFYDMSYTRLAEFFLAEVQNKRIRPRSEEAWFRRIVAEGYVTGQLKVPARYRVRVRRAVLQVKLDEAGATKRS
jgi:hypothetical protein